MGEPTSRRRTRRAVRVLPVNDDGAVLLLRCLTAQQPAPFLITVGGGIEDGETERAAGVRELWEETGMVAAAGDLIGPFHSESFSFVWDADLVTQHQNYYAIAVQDLTVVFDNLEELEVASTIGYGWWTADQLRESTDIVFPEVLRAVEATAAALGRPDPTGGPPGRC